VWLVSIASVATQAALSLWLLRREFRTRLRAAPEAGLAPA
jgi:nitrate reductase gamma subunit